MYSTSVGLNAPAPWVYFHRLPYRISSTFKLSSFAVELSHAGMPRFPALQGAPHRPHGELVWDLAAPRPNAGRDTDTFGARSSRSAGSEAGTLADLDFVNIRF
jgi:hypothetical protein